MYLRHTTRRKDGKTHVYWQLVRSVRRGRKVIQETVAQLGELDAQGRARAAVLARKISGRAHCQGDLFEANAPIEVAAVRLDAVRLQRSRSFGAVWLAWVLCQALKFDELLDGLLPRGREAVSWADVIAILVIGRLCEPSSEPHVAERWYRTTALEDLLGVQSEPIYEERLYRALDRLLPHKQAIEAHLVRRLGELFELDYDLLLHDVTSTYFEGVADPAIARRSYSRDHRPDCVQVNIALVATREGMPLGYEIFPGNRTDVTTVEEIVSGMEARFGKVNRVWVMDRGMVRAENVAWLNQTRRRYVIGTPKAQLRRWARQIEEKADWRHIREDVEVKVCRGPEWQDWARLSEGVYILRTNIAQWSDEELWKTYIQLTEAEAAFRIQKSDLAICPIWHHKQDRIKAHILVCFIAYALWKTLQQWQSRAGLGHAPRTILEEFSRIHAADIVLPLVDTKKPELRIRCVVRPDREQAILLEHLGLTLPERLRPPQMPQM
jgi:transposase